MAYCAYCILLFLYRIACPHIAASSYLFQTYLLFPDSQKLSKNKSWLWTLRCTCLCLPLLLSSHSLSIFRCHCMSPLNLVPYHIQAGDISPPAPTPPSLSLSVSLSVPVSTLSIQAVNQGSLKFWLAVMSPAGCLVSWAATPPDTCTELTSECRRRWGKLTI